MTTAEEWNARHPVGTPVLFWPMGRNEDGRVSHTRSTAWVLGGHTPVVMCDGKAGGIALTHVEPRPEEPSAYVQKLISDAVQAERDRIVNGCIADDMFTMTAPLLRLLEIDPDEYRQRQWVYWSERGKAQAEEEDRELGIDG